MNSISLAPVAARKSLANTVSFGTVNASILLTGEDTGGAFGLVENVMRPGSEPPYHIHDREDETFYVLEGHISVMVDGNVLECHAGDAVFLPRGLPHTFRVRSDIARGLVLVTSAGFEKYFQAIGQPAVSLEPPMPGAGAPDYFAVAGKAAAACGIRIAEHQPQF